MADTATDTGPVPLHIPAILLNPSNRTAKQVEAHNAQQREKIIARRDRGTSRHDLPGGGRGKRVIRRKDNAAFTSNPHITLPTKGDYYPSVPLQSNKSGPSFPPHLLPRSSYVPHIQTPPKDPFSSDSRNGTFGTSLKGVRGLLRRKGRRSEKLVMTVEEELRTWLRSGDGWMDQSPTELEQEHWEEDHDGRESGPSPGDIASTGSSSSSSPWRCVDPHPVDMPAQSTSENMSNATPGPSRRLPNQHRVESILPPLPRTANQVAAVLEISRSPAHLSWAIADGFERLVMHLLARYYDLVSWSEDHLDTQGHMIRLTNIVVPHLVKPVVPPPNGMLPTPETSDASDLSEHPSSASEKALSGDDQGASTDDTDTDTVSETETEVGYSLDPDISQSTVVPHLQSESDRSRSNPAPDLATTRRSDGIQTPSLSDALAELDLHHRLEPSPAHVLTDPDGGGSDDLALRRAWSHGSSAYGSSEGGASSASEGWEALGDSMEFSSPSTLSARDGAAEVGAVAETSAWSTVTVNQGRALPSRLGIDAGAGPRVGDLRPGNVGGDHRKSGQGRNSSWEDRPTFFEYLYGA